MQAVSPLVPSVIPYSWGVPDDRAADIAAGVTTAASAGAAGIKIGTALVGGGAAAAAGGAAAGGAGAAGGLLAAAGASAAVPVVGWVVGAGLALTAGTIALVKGIRKRKLNKQKAIAWAKKLGLPNPEEVPGFVIKLSRKPKDWRTRKLALYRGRLKKVRARLRAWRQRPGARRTAQVLTFGIMRGPARLKRYRTKLEVRIALIEALEASYVERARRRQQTREEQARIAAMKSQEEAAARMAAEAAAAAEEQKKMWLAVGALAVTGVVVAVAVKRRKAKK